MSDTVKPGIYTTEGGLEAHVFGEAEGVWFGCIWAVDLDAASWDCAGLSRRSRERDLILSTWRPFPQPEPEPDDAETVEVRVHVVVSQTGHWFADGSSNRSDAQQLQNLRVEPGEVVHIITARVPLPKPPAEIAAKVEDAG